ncbi:MAG: DUF1559 domain-containing protein [Rubripirellula sp.]|nr:DUF1559 domain-containing protein [Rubripirellula sp.]
MPYLYTCPHCQTKTQVEDRYSGQSGTCVTCGGEIELPRFAVGGTEVPKARSPRSKIAGFGIAAIVAVILAGCLLFAVVRYGGRTVSRIASNRDQAQSVRNLERIAKALNAYAADQGSYPPPVTRDEKGRVLHSWRVLVLPYLGLDELYNSFDLSVAWDDPENMQNAYSIPAVYKHPKMNSFSESAYFLIAGDATLFPADGPLGPNSIADDPSQTILVIEAKPAVASGMWTEPVDLEFSVMSGSLGNKSAKEAGGLFDDGTAMVTADGRGHFLPNSIEPNVFRSLVTPRGGERLPDDTLD